MKINAAKLSKIFTIFLLFCSVIFAKTLTIASYNVENLFDLNDDKTEYDVYKPGVWNLTSYKIKLKNAAFVISKINADIISLQEIESKTVMDDLKTVLSRNNTKYKYLAFEKTKSQAVGVGLFSKYPIVKTKAYSVVNSRPVMRCDIAVDDDTISVFSVHFPSKGHPESERIKAANVVRRAIDTLIANENYEYYITGDFNSDYDEFAKSLTQETDNSKGKTGINHVLKTFRNKHGEKPEISLIPLAKDEHFDPWIEVDFVDRWSYIFRGNRNSLDHILFPQNMTDTIGWRYIYGSFSHFIIPEIMKDGKPYDWQYSRAGKHYNSGYSDHLPIIAKITNESIENIEQSFSLKSEIGLDGWITNHALADLRAVGKTPEGFAIFELNGDKIPSTATVAKLIAISDKDYKMLNMAVRGQGTISFRSQIKTADAKNKWNNVSPVTKETSLQAKYLPFKSEKWENIPILRNISAGDTVAIEIRIQKETPYSIQFCVENLNGWYRETKVKTKKIKDKYE